MIFNHIFVPEFLKLLINMRNLLILFMAVSLLACSKKEDKPAVDYVIFSGDIVNPAGGKLSVSGNKGVIKEFNVDENGKFSDTIKEIKEGFYNFHYGNELSNFYLRPGFNMHLKLDPKEFDESIVYTGPGSEINNYMAKEMLRNEQIDKKITYPYQAKLTEEEYVKKMDSLKQLSLKVLEEQKGIDKDFKTLQSKIISYNWANKILMFEALKRYFTQDPTFKVSEKYPDPTRNIDLEDENMLGVPEYDQILNAHYSILTGKELKNNKDADFHAAFMDVVAKNTKSKRIRNQLLFDFAEENISYAEDIETFYKTFMKYETNEEYKKEITKKYDQLKNLAKGKPSPKFKDYENFRGGTTSLDDFKGKYVYIDVWATWCGPCKAEIPSLKKLTNDYQGKNIVFISMSIDKKTDHEKWKNMVAKEELKGVQIFAPNDWKSDFVTSYGIRGIPRFILISPEGKIVTANAPRPSNPELRSLFTSLGI
jgi:thiol-disulfide isomerase/thioredoxin